MRIVDLFCAAGGASMGLHRAFPEAEIVGVDIDPYGGGDVICPDRHIVNIFLGQRFEEWMFKTSKRAQSFLREVERYFVDYDLTLIPAN